MWRFFQKNWQAVSSSNKDLLSDDAFLLNVNQKASTISPYLDSDHELSCEIGRNKEGDLGGSKSVLGFAWSQWVVIGLQMVPLVWTSKWQEIT